jgi:hypothetical protein
MTKMRRLATALALTVGWVLILAAPASAHSVSGVGATNWKSVITSVSPQVPGLTVRLVEDGSRIELTNYGPEVTVQGYEGEPYLRIGPDGVFENLQSPATYLNCSRTGCSFPAGINKDGPPQWKKISSGQTARWHDHRAHYMGGQPPPDVLQSPGRVHVEASWTITLTRGSTPILVKGNYTWVPSSSPFPWLALAVVLFALGVAAGVLGTWGPRLAVLVALLTVVDIYHAVGIAWFWSGSTAYRLEKFLSGSFYSFIGWVLGALAVWLLVRRRVDGLYAAVFAGGSAALFTGLLDFTVLSRSQAPFAAPITVDRLSVVTSLGLGLGVAVGALLAIRATTPRVEEVYDDEDDEDFAGVDAAMTVSRQRAPGPT